VTLQNHDLALLTARWGAARFGATRFGFIPCPEDVLGEGADEPGAYVWTEQTPESQIVETVWTLQNEDCACRQLCTLAVATMSTSPNPPTQDASFTLTVPLSGVLGSVSGIVRVHWGDGQHETHDVETLADGDLEYTHIYDSTGAKTISVDLTDERGCRVEKTLAVTVGAAVAAVYFTWNQNAESETVSFTAHVGALNVLTIDWDFGEGAGFELDIGTPIGNAYGSAGQDDTYTVQLRVNAVEGVFTDSFDMTTNWAAGQSGSSQ
jgi:hypothetical protein